MPLSISVRLAYIRHFHRICLPCLSAAVTAAIAHISTSNQRMQCNDSVTFCTFFFPALSILFLFTTNEYSIEPRDIRVTSFVSTVHMSFTYMYIQIPFRTNSHLFPHLCFLLFCFHCRRRRYFDWNSAWAASVVRICHTSSDFRL